ncbi:MAG TPA: hypothetical protein VIK48_04680 [Candidatus Manganitrophaceae bacterium]
MIKIKSVLSLFLWGILFSGCVGIDDLSHENYRKGILYIRDFSNETLAVLPMVARGESRRYVQPAEAIFFKALTEMRQSMRLISPEENLAKIRMEGLDSDFERFQQETSFKKVSKEKDLADLRKTLETRFVLQTELQQVETIEGATHIRLQGRLWDIELGDIIWEGTGEARGYLFLFFPRVPASFEKAVEVASRGLIRKLP